MSRLFHARKYAKRLVILSAIILAGLLISNAWRVGAQASLFAPVLLPGDTAPAAAAGRTNRR
jgi:hypothetical protein